MDSSTNLPNDGVLTIERAKWRRGGDHGIGEGDTLMLNEQGFMCCLGFDAKARGVADELILNCSTPFDAAQEWDIDTRKLKAREGIPTDYVEYAMGSRHSAAIRANDKEDCSDERREAAVRDALIALGWNDVVFA